jgi:hypothetical protein
VGLPPILLQGQTAHEQRPGDIDTTAAPEESQDISQYIVLISAAVKGYHVPLWQFLYVPRDGDCTNKQTNTHSSSLWVRWQSQAAYLRVLKLLIALVVADVNEPRAGEV